MEDTLYKPKKDNLLVGLRDNKNYVAGMVVSLVAVPLSIALAIAQGGEPMWGLSAAIYGPFIQGILGGSSYNILGPAGALVNVLAQLSFENGPAIIPIVAITSGFLSLLTCTCADHRYFDEVERQESVLEGFSIAIAITIGCGQLNNAIGLFGLKKQPGLLGNLTETWNNVGDANKGDWVPFLFFFGSLIYLSNKKPAPGTTKKPWIIATAIVGTFYGYIMATFFADYKPRLLKDAYPEMKEASIADFDYIPQFQKIDKMNILIGSLKVAFVAVFETIISAVIAQKKYVQFNGEHSEPMPFTRSSETMGLGLANMVSGLCGGTPVTGVLVRTGVNVQYGGESRASQFINSIYVLVMTLALLPVILYCPMMIVASILLNSAISLGKTSFNLVLDGAKNKNWLEVATILLTGAMCVFIDGAIGLFIGLVVRIIVDYTVFKKIEADDQDDVYEKM